MSNSTPSAAKKQDLCQIPQLLKLFADSTFFAPSGFIGKKSAYGAKFVPSATPEGTKNVPSAFHREETPLGCKECTIDDGTKNVPLSYREGVVQPPSRCADARSTSSDSASELPEYLKIAVDELRMDEKEVNTLVGWFRKDLLRKNFTEEEKKKYDDSNTDGDFIDNEFNAAQDQLRKLTGNDNEIDFIISQWMRCEHVYAEMYVCSMAMWEEIEKLESK